MMMGSFGLAILAWTALYYAMDRQYAALVALHKNVPKPFLLRCLGGVLLMLSLSSSIAEFGATVGFAAWWVLLAVSAFVFTVGRVLLSEGC
jgi:hypothetical protein